MKIIGAFFFNDDGDGCISGKWVNEGEFSPHPETAKFQGIIQKQAEPFCGSYATTWIEQKNVVINGSLEITKCQNKVGVYELKWFDDKNKPLFDGIGMLCKDTLVGSYWDPA